MPQFASYHPKDVLRVQLPGFDQLDTYGRYLAEKDCGPP